MEAESPVPGGMDDASRRRLAVDLFNHTWELLRTPDRTPAQDDEMIHCAHASRYHWGEVGQALQLAVGEWQCSRVYSVLGRSEAALWHARRAVAISEGNSVERWCVASAYEAMARASLVAGDTRAAREWLAKARATLAEVTDPEDADVVRQDLDSLGLG